MPSSMTSRIHLLGQTNNKFRDSIRNLPRIIRPNIRPNTHRQPLSNLVGMGTRSIPQIIRRLIIPLSQHHTRLQLAPASMDRVEIRGGKVAAVTRTIRMECQPASREARVD